MKDFSFVNSKLLRVLITLFTIALGYGVILPVLPFYTERLALSQGLTTERITYHIGFLTSVYPFFQMFFAPLWGRWSDKLGRKPLIIIGLLGFVIMQLLIGISTSLVMFYLARIIGGVFTSAIIPASYALVSDLTTKDKRTVGIALAGTAYSLGIVAGPIIGGILSKTDLHLNSEFGHFLINDFSIPFFFLALTGLILLPIVSNGLKNTDSLSDKKIINTRVFHWLELVLKLFPVLLLSFMYQLTLTLFESVFSIYSKNELLFDAMEIGYGFMVCALVMALLQPLVVSPKVKEVISQHYQIILGLGIFGLGIFLLAFVSHLIFVLLLIGLLAVGGAFITPNITSIISLKGGESSGSSLGIQKSIDSLGQVLGPIIGSWLLTVDSSLPYLLTGTVIVFITLIFVKNRRLFVAKT